ncbi:unnamed protein product [Calypogeia fissa]
MEFCSTCANLLLVEHASLGRLLRFFCPTCPYVYSIERKISKKLPLKQKEVDDVLGGEDAWKNVDRTEGTCFSFLNTLLLNQCVDASYI